MKAEEKQGDKALRSFGALCWLAAAGLALGQVSVWISNGQKPDSDGLSVPKREAGALRYESFENGKSSWRKSQAVYYGAKAPRKQEAEEAEKFYFEVSPDNLHYWQLAEQSWAQLELKADKDGKARLNIRTVSTMKKDAQVAQINIATNAPPTRFGVDENGVVVFSGLAPNEAHIARVEAWGLNHQGKEAQSARDMDTPKGTALENVFAALALTYPVPAQNALARSEVWGPLGRAPAGSLLGLALAVGFMGWSARRPQAGAKGRMILATLSPEWANRWFALPGKASSQNAPNLKNVMKPRSSCSSY